MTQPEARLQRRIQEALRKEGCYAVKIWGGPFQKAGTPDILGCYQGRFFALEVKTDTGRPSVLQEYTLKDIRAAGGIAAIVRSVDDALRAIRPVPKGRSRVRP